MPTFDTPEPISVSLELGVADVRIVATDRPDTEVQVTPTDPAKESDVTAAEQTRVEYAAGRLVVRAPKNWKRYGPWGGSESIDVRIGLPAGSDVQGDASLAALYCTGRLGECRYKTSGGDIVLGQAGPVRLRTSAGDISVDRALEHAEVSTGTGELRIGAIDGTGIIKNSNGDTWVGAISGDLRVNSANGNIAVGRSQASVAAKTASGSIRLREVAGGEVTAQTAFGKIDIGLRDGVAAWLDLHTRFGHVLNSLDSAGQPQSGDSVEIRAHTSYGDITIARVISDPPAGNDTPVGNDIAADES